MTTVIIGSEGNVGRRLRPAFPDVVGIDRTGSPDILADLAAIDYASEPIRGLLASAAIVIHVATSASVDAPDDVHYQAVIDAARLVAACQRVPIPRLLLPSSDWAEPKLDWTGINTYGHSKRVFETMAAMYRHSTGAICTALRIGWVALPGQYETAADWLKANYWDDARLIAEVYKALEL